MMPSVMPIALTDLQMSELMAVARHVPRWLRDQYLQTVAALLQDREIGDADVWRACHAAANRCGRAGPQASPRHRGRFRPAAPMTSTHHGGDEGAFSA
jgi:hypothetical protein